MTDTGARSDFMLLGLTGALRLTGVKGGEGDHPVLYHWKHSATVTLGSLQNLFQTMGRT